MAKTALADGGHPGCSQRTQQPVRAAAHLRANVFEGGTLGDRVHYDEHVRLQVLAIAYVSGNLQDGMQRFRRRERTESCLILSYSSCPAVSHRAIATGVLSICRLALRRKSKVQLILAGSKEQWRRAAPVVVEHCGVRVVVRVVAVREGQQCTGLADTAVADHDHLHILHASRQVSRPLLEKRYSLVRCRHFSRGASSALRVHVQLLARTKRKRKPRKRRKEKKRNTCIRRAAISRRI
jgi:hypothetical protein